MDRNGASSTLRWPSARAGLATRQTDLEPEAMVKPLAEAKTLHTVPSWIGEVERLWQEKEATRMHEQATVRSRRGPVAHLRKSKVVEWVLGYLALAVVAVEVMSLQSSIWGLPSGLDRSVSVVLGMSVLPVAVISWYHGEKGWQRITAPEILIVGLMVVTIATGAWVVGV